MTVLSDKWIKKTVKKKDDQTFVDKQIEKEKFLLDYHLMVMMQGFQMNLKFY